jgi:2-polyprenyl-3-methyl-5-hydroxy-6-metoxy-1,4-benzoquinol methylase
MDTTVAPTPELFFDTLMAHQRTAALKTAIALDLFTAIGDGAQTVDAIAKATSASARGTRILCDFLTIIGFLIKTGDTYALSPTSAPFLTRRSPAYLGGSVEFLNSPEIVDNFKDLTGTVQRGTVQERSNTVSEENPVWEKFARAMMPMMVPAAQAIADILKVDTAGRLRVLDIAAGHGIFGITIAQRNSQAEVVAVDWKNVLAVASGHADAMGVGPRHRALAGDAFTTDWGIGYDIALVTNFLHHFDQPTCTSFLRKVAASLQPGGRVAILEFVPNDDRVTPPTAAAFAMTMLGGTPAGDAYTFKEFSRMLEAAGFTSVSRHDLQGPETVIVGTT